MTPKMQALPKALKMLQHDFEVDADKMYDRITRVHERKNAAFARNHKMLDASETDLGELEKFAEEMEKATNAGPPLEGSSNSPEHEGPRSSEFTDTTRKVA